MADTEPIRVIVHLRAKADSITDAENILAKIAAPSRSNPDCLEFRIFRDKDDPAVFTLFEYWRSFEANRAHAERQYMAEYTATKDTIFTSIDGDFVEEISP